MGTLSSFKIACHWRLLVACLALPTIARAEVNLDKLSACEDIARLYDTMKSRPVDTHRNCRSPRNTLERELVARGGLDISQLCLDQSAPAPFLMGFSCFWTEVKVGALLECFRSADVDDIMLYKADYQEKFAAPVSTYKSASAACRVSNGDSAEAQWTLFPPLLSFIARFEFGFITGLGKKSPPDSYIVHGYAATDPTISGNVPSAIEFVYAITEATMYLPASEQKTTVGTWVVDIDEAEELDESLKRLASKQRFPLFIDSISYSLERYMPGSISQGAKLAQIQGFQQQIAESLEDEGFEAISDADLQAETGKHFRDIFEESTTMMPFGFRQRAPGKLGSTMLVLINERRPKCTRDQTGTMAAFIRSSEPVPEVMSDFGGITLLIIGFGSCDHTTTISMRTYASGLIEEATSRLLTALKDE